MGYVRVNEAQLYYETYGTGTPLVLSHGGWTDTTHWSPNVSDLARRWQVIVYDRRDCGRSAGDGRTAHSWQLWRDDLRGLLEALGIESAYLGGCSYGALISLELALERPEMARALILESGTPDGIAGSGPELVPFPSRVADLGRIRAPTLIIQGEHDPFWPPPVAERLQAGIAGSELLVVRGAGHVPHLDDPELFNRTVESFLLRVEGAGG